MSPINTEEVKANIERAEQAVNAAQKLLLSNKSLSDQINLL